MAQGYSPLKPALSKGTNEKWYTVYILEEIVDQKKIKKGLQDIQEVFKLSQIINDWLIYLENQKEISFTDPPAPAIYLGRLDSLQPILLSNWFLAVGSLYNTA